MSKTLNSAALSFLTDDKSEGQGSVISVEKTDFLLHRIDELMTEQKPFLRHGYSLNALAQDVGIHTYQMSAFLNVILGQHFNHFINGYRIRYCLEILQSNENRRLKVHKIASKCGFSNRNSFISAFKLHTHKTYSEVATQERKTTQEPK